MIVMHIAQGLTRQIKPVGSVLHLGVLGCKAPLLDQTHVRPAMAALSLQNPKVNCIISQAVRFTRHTVVRAL